MDLNSSSSAFDFPILDKLFAVLKSITVCIRNKTLLLGICLGHESCPPKIRYFKYYLPIKCSFWGEGYFFLPFPAI